MKQILFLITAASFIQLSCSKKEIAVPVPTSLEGHWRMISVTESSSGATTTKPSSVQGDVDIVFNTLSSNRGAFFGYTPTNTIFQSNYSTDANHSLAVPALNMTKVGETSWGNEFVSNIRYSRKYSFESNGILNIKTANKILTFKKV
jgi:hypothetical protein